LNKLMLIPLTIMIFLMVISLTYSTTTMIGNYSSESGGEIVIDNETGSVDIPEAGEHEFNLGGAQGALVLLIIAIAVGTASGIRILGSGLSDYSQALLFKSIALMGLWAILTVFTFDLIFTNEIIGSIIWILLTIMFVLGFVSSSGNNE